MRLRKNINYWMKVINAYKSSGQTQKTFCQSNGLNYHTFKNWTYKLNKSRLSKGQLKPLKIVNDIQSAKSDGLLIQLPSKANLILPQDMDNHKLKSLLKTLGLL